MRDKIIKRFLATTGSLCVLYGSVSTVTSMVPEGEMIPPATITEEYNDTPNNDTEYFDSPPQNEGDTSQDANIPNDNDSVITDAPE